MSNEKNTNMETSVIRTETRIIGTGLYDNGQYADTYNKTECFDVEYDGMFVYYSRIVNGVCRGTSRQELKYITNTDILEAVKKLQTTTEK